MDYTPKEDITPESQADDKPKIDTGLACLVMIAKYHGLAADPAQIKHAFAIGADGMHTTDIVRAARELGLSSKAATVDYEKLRKLSLPAIAETETGPEVKGEALKANGVRQYIIIAKADAEQVLTMNPAENKPRVFKKDDFLALWIVNNDKAKGGKTFNLSPLAFSPSSTQNGNVILISYRGPAFLNSEEVFGLKWFIPAIWKYRRALSTVLIASFVLQVFALVTPIFTQVIIDKVLVHRGVTTLDVLAIGLLVIAVFEAVMNILRKYVFTHTTSKIDVTLGVRLFKHLLALPLRYFEVRRVGDTVARIRELENIRQFLTGAPLTSVLDIMFMVVFVIVMFFYSATLTLVALAALPLFAALSAVVTPILRHRLDERFNRGADTQSYLVEAVSGVQTVKSFSLEPEVQKKWEGLLSSYIRASFKTYQLSGSAGAIGQFIQRSSYLVILWIGAHLVMDGKLTVGQLIAFQMLSGRVSDPVLRLVQMWQDFQQAGLSIRRLGDIFNSKPEPAMNPTKARLPAIKGRVRFESVRFRYRVDGSEILRNISFELEAEGSDSEGAPYESETLDI